MLHVLRHSLQTGIPHPPAALSRLGADIPRLPALSRPSGRAVPPLHGAYSGGAGRLRRRASTALDSRVCPARSRSAGAGNPPSRGAGRQGKRISNS